MHITRSLRSCGSARPKIERSCRGPECVALPHHARGRVSTLAVSGGPQGASQGAAAPVQQQEQEQQQQQQQEPAAFHSSSWYKSHFDLTLWHYLPWWLQPAPIIASGAIFFAAALVIDNEEPTLKAAVIAAGPVALYYAIALFVLPSQFQKFAVNYMRKHPELEQAASAQSSRDASD